MTKLNYNKSRKGIQIKFLENDREFFTKTKVMKSLDECSKKQKKLSKNMAIIKNGKRISVPSFKKSL